MEWKTTDMGVRLSHPQCHPMNNGKDIAIIGAEKDPFIYLIAKGVGKPIKLKEGEYPSRPRGHCVVSIHDEKKWKKRVEMVIAAWVYPKRMIPDLTGLFHLFYGTFINEFISFGGRQEHFDRISVNPKTNKVHKEHINSSIKDKLPAFGMRSQGIFVNECGWSHLIVTGGGQKGHGRSISMIHFPSHKVTHFKDVLPFRFACHAMIPLSSVLSSNTLGFILILHATTLQCIYNKDENKWDFKELHKPPRIQKDFMYAGWVLYQDKWIIGVGGCVNYDAPSKLIRIFNIPCNEWIVSPIELPKGLCLMGTCIIDNDLHVIGGSDGDESESTHYSIPLSMIIPSPAHDPMIAIDSLPNILTHPSLIDSSPSRESTSNDHPKQSPANHAMPVRWN